MQPASELVSRVLDGYNLAETIRRIRLRLEWSRIVGRQLAARTRPDYVKDGILHVRVWDSSWLHHLSFMRDTIVATINERMGDPPLVSAIEMKIGRFYPRDVTPQPTQRQRGPDLPRWRSLPEPATGERLKEIEEETACIEDAELRQVVTDLRRRWNV